jgi:hypothetical protein
MKSAPPSRLVLLALAVLSVIVLLARTHSLAQDKPGQLKQRPPDAIQQMLDARTAIQKEFRLGILVQPGTEQEAKDYYQRISGRDVLNFQFEGSTLDSLFAYIGYTTPNDKAFVGLLANDLETVPSFALMPRDEGEFASSEAAGQGP